MFLLLVSKVVLIFSAVSLGSIYIYIYMINSVDLCQNFDFNPDFGHRSTAANFRQSGGYFLYAIYTNQINATIQQVIKINLSRLLAQLFLIEVKQS